MKGWLTTKTSGEEDIDGAFAAILNDADGCQWSEGSWHLYRAYQRRWTRVFAAETGHDDEGV